MCTIKRNHDSVASFAGTIKSKPFRVSERTDENCGFPRQAIRNFVGGINRRDNPPVAPWYPVPP